MDATFIAGLPDLPRQQQQQTRRQQQQNRKQIVTEGDDDTSEPVVGAGTGGGSSKRGVQNVALNIDPWIERGIYIFSAVGSTVWLARLRPLGSDSAVLVLFLLIIMMFLFLYLKNLVEVVSNRYAPKEFSSAFIVIMKVLEFISLTSVFVVSAYSITLLSGLWVSGHLTFGEAFISIVVLVSFVFAIAVVHHDVRTAFDRLEQRRQQLLHQQQQQQQQSAQTTGATSSAEAPARPVSILTIV